MYIRRSEDVSDVFWTSNLRLVYILCSEDALRNSRRNYAYKFLSLLKLNLCDTPELHPEFHQISKVELFESRFDLLKTVSFCRKKLHLRYLTAFYISFCTGESTPSNQAWEVSNLIISRKCIQFYLHSNFFLTKKLFVNLFLKDNDFIYQILGTLYHVCSKKPVCAKDGKLEGGNKIVIDSNCPKLTYWGFSRNMCKLAVGGRWLGLKGLIKHDLLGTTSNGEEGDSLYWNFTYQQLLFYYF